MPGAVADLAELASTPAGHRIAGIAVPRRPASAVTGFRTANISGVRRQQPAAPALPRRSRDGRGQDQVPAPVEEKVENREDHVLVDGEPAAYLVAAEAPALAENAAPARPRAAAARADGSACAASRGAALDAVRRGALVRTRRAYVTPVGETEPGRRGESSRTARGRSRACRRAPTCWSTGWPVLVATGARCRPAPGDARRRKRAGCYCMATPPATSTRSPGRQWPGLAQARATSPAIRRGRLKDYEKRPTSLRPPPRAAHQEHS